LCGTLLFYVEVGWLVNGLTHCRRLDLMRSLLAPYENRPWAQTNWILVQMWKVMVHTFIFFNVFILTAVLHVTKIASSLIFFLHFFLNGTFFWASGTVFALVLVSSGCLLSVFADFSQKKMYH